MAPRTLGQRLFYRFWWWFTRYLLLIFYRVRVFGEYHVPRTGGTLVLGNHQSHFDPPTIGSLCQRRLNYVARKSLFKWPLNLLIGGLDAIPIDQEGIGLSGFKETLKRLKGGEGVLLFPEGSRTLGRRDDAAHAGFCGAGSPLPRAAGAGGHRRRVPGLAPRHAATNAHRLDLCRVRPVPLDGRQAAL